MRIQVSLNVNEAKKVIAKGIATMPVVARAMSSGRIFLKGGSTVSGVCEELVGEKLRISGRISPLGTKTAQVTDGGYHCAVLEKGRFRGLEGAFKSELEIFNNKDVAIIGANAIDKYGNTALMYGVAMGGLPGEIISGISPPL